jgi:hypothetical protein
VDPDQYFPIHYYSDFSLFFGRRAKIPTSHRETALCGMTLGSLFEPEKRARFVSPADFLCCQYELNLLHQGIYTYYREHHPMWLLGSSAFLDIRGCRSGHGGLTTNPGGILRFARDPSYIPNAQPVEITPKQLAQYTQFFFLDYLPSVYRGDFLPPQSCTYPSQQTSPIDPQGFLERLRNDPNCFELRTFA